MELDRIIRDYWKCCKNNDEWYKDNQPEYMDKAKKALIVALIVAIIIIAASLFIESTLIKAVVEITAVGLMVGVVLRVQKYIDKNETAEEKKHLTDSKKDNLQQDKN